MAVGSGQLGTVGSLLFSRCRSGGLWCALVAFSSSPDSGGRTFLSSHTEAVPKNSHSQASPVLGVRVCPRRAGLRCGAQPRFSGAGHRPGVQALGRRWTRSRCGACPLSLSGLRHPGRSPVSGRLRGRPRLHQGHLWLPLRGLRPAPTALASWVDGAVCHPTVVGLPLSPAWVSLFVGCSRAGGSPAAQGASLALP